MKRPSKKSTLQSAFSLVELLVVIAVIAVIAAIAIPNIGNITGAASQAAQLRNAQNLVSTWNNYVEAANAANVAAATITAAKPTAADFGAIATTAGLSVVNTRLNTTMTFSVQGITVATTAISKINFADGGNYLVYQPDAAAGS